MSRIRFKTPAASETVDPLLKFWRRVGVTKKQSGDTKLR